MRNFLFLLLLILYIEVEAQQTILMGSVSSVNACGGVLLYDSGGPSGNYGNNENSVITFYPDMSGNVLVGFCSNLYLLGNDYLKVYCGPDTLSPLMGTYFSGSNFWLMAENPFGALTFQFRSDSTLNDAGWAINFLCRPFVPMFQQVPVYLTCENIFWFSDPGLCDSYLPNLDLTQTIFPATTGGIVRIDYLGDWDLGNGDYLEIHDGPTVTDPLLAVYYPYPAPTFPLSLISSHFTGALTLRFVSDGIEEGKGFIGQFSACPPLPDCPNIISPQDGENAVILNNNSSLTLIWHTAYFYGPALNYTINFGNTTNPPYFTNTTDTFLTISNLQPGETYYWSVIANFPLDTTICNEYVFTTSSQFLDLLPYSGAAVQGNGVQLGINGIDVSFLNFFYSTDGGANYTPFAGYEPFTNGYVWVPIPSFGNIVIKIVDSFNPLIWDTISIQVNELQLQVTDPQNSQEFLFLDDFTINWISNFPIDFPDQNNVTIEIKQNQNPWEEFFDYHISGGLSTNNVFTHFDALSNGFHGGNPLVSGTYNLAIDAQYGNGMTTTTPFFIKDIIINSPNGSEILTPGTSFPIVASSNIDDTYTVEFSSDGGNNWSVITNSFVIDNSISSTTSYNWTVPSVSSNICLVRLVKPSAPGIVFDQSNDYFTIQCSATSSITPNGSTTFCSGDSVELSAPSGTGYTYQWLFNGNTISGATSQQYTANTGGNYTVTVTANGCSNTSANTQVVIHPLPAIPVVTFNGNALESSYPSGNQWYFNGGLLLNDTAMTLVPLQTGSYHTCYTDLNGCASCSLPFLITGLEGYTGTTAPVCIYPVPVDDLLFVNVPFALLPAVADIFSVDGKHLSQNLITEPNAQIDFSSNPKGYYQLKITGADGSRQVKPVIRQ